MINDALYMAPNDSLGGFFSNMLDKAKAIVAKSAGTTSSRSGSTTTTTTTTTTKTYKCSDGTVLTLDAAEYDKRNGEYLSLKGRAGYEGVALPKQDNVMRGNGYAENLALQARINAKNKAIQEAKEQAAAESIAPAGSNTSKWDALKNISEQLTTTIPANNNTLVITDPKVLEARRLLNKASYQIPSGGYNYNAFVDVEYVDGATKRMSWYTLEDYLREYIDALKITRDNNLPDPSWDEFLVGNGKSVLAKLKGSNGKQAAGSNASNGKQAAVSSASNVQAETPESNGGWWKWLLGGAGVIGLYFIFKTKKRKRK